jgi:hypothetical protein
VEYGGQYNKGGQTLPLPKTDALVLGFTRPAGFAQRKNNQKQINTQ